MKVSVENDGGITPMDKFEVTTSYITCKNNHTWVSTVHVLDRILQGNINSNRKYSTYP